MKRTICICDFCENEYQRHEYNKNKLYNLYYCADLCDKCYNKIINLIDKIKITDKDFMK